MQWQIVDYSHVLGIVRPAPMALPEKTVCGRLPQLKAVAQRTVLTHFPCEVQKARNCCVNDQNASQRSQLGANCRKPMQWYI